ncbi:dolichol-phosphate mannosyltransferase subunit 3 [Gyrodon lividus]|nr:dolichol-phosphate mannosyltransferase subunit 3 [Gyrodon lividus]
MARAHRLAVYASASLTLYLLALFSVMPIPFIEPEVSAQILPLIPWWLLVAFGSYCLWSLGWGVFTFRDCPEAYHELLKEINDAKNDLRGRGVTVD